MEFENCGIIPMHKNSKWERYPEPLETSGFTTDMNVWFDRMVKTIRSEHNQILDEAIAIKAKGYFFGPLCLIEGEAYSAKAKSFNTLDEIELFMDKNNVYLYMICMRSWLEHRELKVKFILRYAIQGKPEPHNYIDRGDDD